MTTIRRGLAGSGVALLDEHSDPTHNRTVFTLAGEAEPLERALAELARRAIEAIDMARQEGAHPRIGALDVCPVVWPDPRLREPARAAALLVAEALAELGLPVFLYGELASSAERSERAYFRHGGPHALAERMRSGEVAPDLGPAEPHPSAGGVLVTARPPLAAFNVELAGADLDGGREIAAQVRESGGGLAGVRAIAIDLGEGRIQVSTNVHDPAVVPVGRVVEDVRRLALDHDARPIAAELIGLIPAASLDGYPEDVPIAGADPHTRTIEARLGSLEQLAP